MLNSDRLNVSVTFVCNQALFVMLKMLFINIFVFVFLFNGGLYSLSNEGIIIFFFCWIISNLTFFVIFMFEVCYRYYLRFSK